VKEGDHQNIVAIPKPKGEAGDKKNGFNLRAAMQLDSDAQKDLYDAIQVCDLEGTSPDIGDSKILYTYITNIDLVFYSSPFSVPFAPMLLGQVWTLPPTIAGRIPQSWPTYLKW
jgi:hypothetical protein